MCDIRALDDEQLPASTGVHAFVVELLLTLTNSRIYSPDHPRVRSSLDALSGLLGELAADSEHGTLQIGAADGYLFHDRRPLLAASQAAPRLLKSLEDLNSGGVEFHRGATADEFYAMARLLDRRDLVKLDVLTANLELERNGSKHIRFLSTYTEGEGDDEGLFDKETLDGLPTIEVSARLYQEVFDHLTDVATASFRGELFRIEDTKMFVERILKRLRRSAGETLAASQYEYNEADQFQFRHSIRVASLALFFARGLTNDQRLLERIGAAAMLHDVGKSQLDWQILHKAGRLTPDERAEMEKHAHLGARLLLDVEDTDPMAVATAFGHHRNLDGGGYPSTRHQPELSMATRLVRVCDVYEALTARRPYKAPMSPVKSYRIMCQMSKDSGGQIFDMPLLHRFVLINGIYPVGSWVKLDTGEAGLVLRQTPALERPLLSLEKEQGSIQGDRAFFDVVPRPIDLYGSDEGREREIVEWLGYFAPQAA